MSEEDQELDEDLDEDLDERRMGRGLGPTTGSRETFLTGEFGQGLSFKRSSLARRSSA